MPEAGGIGSIGELLVEFVCGDKGGRHGRAGVYSGPFPSGAPGIFIDQAARCGGRCIFAGAVGDDAFGHVILDRLKADGVDPSLIAIVPGVPTGSAFVSYNEDGSRDFVYNILHSAASRLVADNAMLEKFSDFGTEIIHVSGSVLGSPDMCAKVLLVCRELHKRGVRISFDPNLRKELMGEPSYLSAIGQLIDICAFFLPSEDDAAALFPGEKLDSLAAKLFAKSAEFVVLKQGENGASGVSRSGGIFSLGAQRVEVVDPTGAGDCFCATFVTLISSGGFSFEKALQYANAAGALAVTKVGPMEGNSGLRQIEAFLAGRA